MILYLVVFLVFCFIGIPYIAYKVSDNDSTVIPPFLFLGLIVAMVGGMVGEHATNKQIGYSIVDKSQIIVEKGEYSCTFHIKNDAGSVSHTIRIDKAMEIAAFNKNNYIIARKVNNNIWLGNYTSDIPQFVISSTEK